jgi:hypothetical protein
MEPHVITKAEAEYALGQRDRDERAFLQIVDRYDAETINRWLKTFWLSAATSPGTITDPRR